MKKFLLQDASNASWVKAQEAQAKKNSSNDQIRLQAYPELSRISRDSVDLKAAEAIIKQRQLYRLCEDVIQDVVDVALASIDTDDGKPPRAPRATNRYYRTFTWKERSVAIFYYLHPSLGNMDAEVTCRVWYSPYYVLSNWISKASYYPKWIPFLENMTVRSALISIPTEFSSLINLSEPELKSRLQIPIRFRSPTTKRFITATSQANLARHKATKIAKKSKGVQYLTESIKTVTKSRSLKYQTETMFLLELDKRSWGSGNPISRNEIYLHLIKQFGNCNEAGSPSEFCSTMKLNEG